MSYQYSKPVSEKSSYAPSEFVNFRVVLSQGMSITPNSMRLSGKGTFYSTGTTAVVNTDRVYYDGQVGFHGLVDTSICRLAGQTIETINDYPRWIKNKIATNTSKDQCFGSSNGNAEGRVGSNGLVTRNRLIEDPSFSVKVDNAFNNTNGAISFAKGTLEVSVRLAQGNQFLFGDDCAPDCGYALTDLVLEYRVQQHQPEDDAPLMVEVKHSVRQTLNQTSSNQISVTCPIPANNVVANCIPVNSYNNELVNGMGLANLDATVAQVEFSINDTIAYEKFPFDSDEEILYNWLLASSGRNNGLNCLSNFDRLNQGAFGLGFHYYRYWEPSSLFGIRIENSAALSEDYFLFLYFLGAVEV